MDSSTVTRNNMNIIKPIQLNAKENNNQKMLDILARIIRGITSDEFNKVCKKGIRCLIPIWTIGAGDTSSLDFLDLKVPIPTVQTGEAMVKFLTAWSPSIGEKVLNDPSP
jgi:hypothetical protein